jgi:hypothetical protein
MCEHDSVVRERQMAIRREMIRRGISVKQVQLDGEWKNPSTVLSHFPNPDGDQEPATMSVATLYRLIATKALPTELLSMLLPDGFAIVPAPEGVDYDEISSVCRDFISEKDRFHHPESEAGRDLGPTEQARLATNIVTLRGRIA